MKVAFRRRNLLTSGMRAVYFFLTVLWAMASVKSAEPRSVLGKPLPQAHAHNDYEHPRPLLDALENGFCGVEADIHLVGGELLVAHDPEDVQPGRTLENLYLAPLWELVKEHRGRAYPGGPSVMLLIDLKTEAEPTYRALKPVLEKYRAMLTHFEPGNIQTNAVTVVLSGNRPRELLMQEDHRLAAYDGRLTDLQANLPASFAPLISDNWRNQFTWEGSGPIPASEREKLERLVNEAHRQGKKIRFWAVPDQPSAWEVLADAGVDLINTDRLGELRKFLEARSEP